MDYPGRNAIVCEMLDAWRQRNCYVRQAFVDAQLPWSENFLYLNPNSINEDVRSWKRLTAKERRRLLSLRRVWHELRTYR